MADISEKRVEQIFRSCLFVKKRDRGAWVGAKGIVLKARFEAHRLEAYKAEVRDFLNQLSVEFGHSKLGEGGPVKNMVYLRAEMNKKWTEDPKMVDKLLCLALAMNLARYLLIREYWEYHPEGAMVTFYI